MKRTLPILLAGFLLCGVTCGTSKVAVAQTDPAPDPVTNAPPLSAEVAMFYGALAPYGRWFWLDPYGWVWTPSGLDVAWRPYTCGAWAYADCGWTWVSDFEWGWAPFHYGRWCWHAKDGWCWVPGSAWAPAWVAWYFGDIWCGWAPMPPLVAWEAAPNWNLLIKPFAWCFVEQRDFLRRHLHDHVVVAARNGTLLHRTKNVTRFEVRDSRVVNLSLSAEQIEQATGRSVPHYRIVDVESARAARMPPNSKNELRLFRLPLKQPKLATTARAFAPQSRLLRAPGVMAPPTIGELRHHEIERRRLATSQAKQLTALERWHQRELQQPPLGISPMELQYRHQAEHRAFLDQLHREDELFESRAQEYFNRVPYEVEHVLPPNWQARAGRASGGNR